MFILSDNEIRQLVRFIIKHRGLGLCRSDFDEHVLDLFEDIAELELLSLQADLDYLPLFWRFYCEYQYHTH